MYREEIVHLSDTCQFVYLSDKFSLQGLTKLPLSIRDEMASESDMTEASSCVVKTSAEAYALAVVENTRSTSNFVCPAMRKETEVFKVGLLHIL